VGLSFEDQRPFASMSPSSEKPGTEMQPEFHGHVETRYPGTWVEFDSRQIVDSPIALANHLGDLTHPDFGSVRRIERTPRVVA
jgi:hypothetical protein